MVIRRTDVDVQLDVFVPPEPEGSTGLLLAARVSRGGCDMQYADDGVYLWVSLQEQEAYLAANYSEA